MTNYLKMTNKPKIAIVRGKFLNRYEMQFFEPLTREFDITAFGSLTPYHDKFDFPVIKLPSPMDLPDFPYKMPILNRIFIDAHYLWGLEEKLKGFDLVHTAETYFHYTQQCLNVKKKGYVKKVIATVLENIPFNNEGIWGRKAFKKRAREELDQIIALTNLTRETLIQEGADPKKITVISHFIDTKRFYPRKILNKSDYLKILFVGRLEAYKGVFEFVNAASRLLNDNDLRGYKLRFTLVGDGGEKENLKRLLNKLEIDKFVAIKEVTYDEMPEIYRSADIFVAPSKPQYTRSVFSRTIVTDKSRSDPIWEEQYNTSLLEAQASGLPIVTTRTGGIPENVGDAAILVEPGNLDSLTNALKKFITDPKLRLKFAEKARDRAVKVHDIQIGAKKMTELYHKILES